MTSQRKFVNCNKCTTLVQDFDIGVGCVHVGAGSIREISLPSAQFCYGPKTTLKSKVYF